MGGICGSCSRPVAPQELTIVLEMAMFKCHIPELTDDQRNQINQMIANVSSRELKLGQFQVFLQKKNQPNEQRQIGKSNERLVYCPIIGPPYKGLIIYEDGYYHGEIVNLCAESQKGTFYYSYNATEHIIEGVWERDQLKKGKISVISNGFTKELFQIERKGEKASIKFAPDEDHDILSYEGTIKWQKLVLREALTGSGRIQFKNGSVYIGGIKNGLMDTQETQTSATFKTRGQTQVYEGSYKEGLRHGLGSTQIKEGAMKYLYSLNWINGQPNIQSMQYESRDVRDTYLRMSGNRF